MTINLCMNNNNALSASARKLFLYEPVQLTGERVFMTCLRFISILPCPIIVEEAQIWANFVCKIALSIFKPHADCDGTLSVSSHVFPLTLSDILVFGTLNHQPLTKYFI